MSAKCDKRKKMCVVFDIDETLIHFVNSKYRQDSWDLLADSEKSQFDYTDNENSKNKHIILFRPGLKELFTYFNNNRELIQVGLWTYSDVDYCKDIANKIIKYVGLPNDFFLFLLSDDDIDPDDHAKNLNVIYKKYSHLSSFNTFIVDDLFGNIIHDVNKENCILVQPFAPFSTDKQRKAATEVSLRQSINDDIFKTLKDVCVKVQADINGCEPEDIDIIAENPEPVFSPKRIKRMGLDYLLKTYVTKTISVPTIGEAHQSRNLPKMFFEMNDNNKRNIPSGGARKSRRRQKRKTLRKIRRAKSTKRKMQRKSQRKRTRRIRRR